MKKVLKHIHTFNNNGPLCAGVKSEKRIFNINEVELDFYFGNSSNNMSPDDIGTSSISKCISVALYFYSHKYEENYNKSHDDYKNIEGFHLIKEYEWEDLITEENQVKIKEKIFIFC